MANKKYSEFVAGTPAGTDLLLYGDPSTGLLKKVTIDNMSAAVGLGIIKRVKVTKTFADFSDPSGQKTINTGFELPTGGIVHGVAINATTLFDTVDPYYVAVGVGSDADYRKYLSNTQVDAAANESPNYQPFTVSGSGANSIDSMSAATPITATAISAPSLLNTATQGEVDIWIYYSVLD